MKELRKKVQNKNVIFFDIFDTILHRRIEPEYVKKIWAVYISKMFIKNCSSNTIYKFRNKIEAQLCSENVSNGGSPEFDYKMMIKKIYERFSSNIDCSEKDFVLRTQEVEFEIEKNALYVDEEMLKDIIYFFKNGKKLYCICDMYLYADVIKDLFIYFKIDKYFKNLFISSQYLHTKSDGSLYGIVLEKLKFDPKDCIMIGDNSNSDIVMASQNKIDSFFVDADEFKKYYDSFRLKNSFERITQTIIEESNNYSNKEYESMAYPLYLFTRNLYFDLIKDGAKNVFFFAREGQFLKKIFDTFQENIIGPKVNTYYLCVSRAATFLGSLKDINSERFSNLLKQYPNISLKVFCENLCFTIRDIEKLSNELNIDFDKNIENIVSSPEFEKLLSNKSFIQKYDSYRNQSKELFKKYLNSFNVDYSERLFVVDVGWKGTIQNNMQLILPKTKIIGYYLGLVHYDKIKNYNQKKAVLFENSLQNKSKNGYLYNSNRSIFEILLAADHGSTIKYEKNGKAVVPVFNSQQKELDLYNNIICNIQDTIFEKFTKISNILKYQYFDDELIEKKFNNCFFKLMFKPSKREIETYNKFYHFENFGVMNYSYFNKKNELSIFGKIKIYRHFRSFIQNDDSWQYLKLHNNGMKFGKFVLYYYKKYRFKKNQVI